MRPQVKVKSVLQAPAWQKLINALGTELVDSYVQTIGFAGINDQYTRALISSAFNRIIQSKPWVESQFVKCDAENNPPSVVNNNDLVVEFLITFSEGKVVGKCTVAGLQSYILK